MWPALVSTFVGSKTYFVAAAIAFPVTPSGEALGVTDTQVRKDLASLGSLGQPGIGYDVGELIAAIRSTLGIDRPWCAVLVGVGNLARALLRYQGFAERGFRIVALFD